MRGSNRRVTDAGLVHLKELTTLRKLHLEDSDVTGAGLVNLRGLNNSTACFFTAAKSRTLDWKTSGH